MLTPKVPSTLKKPESKKIWDRLNKEFELDFSQQTLLRTALERLERYVEAKEVLDKEGLTFRTTEGGIKKHPAVEIEKVSYAGFLQAWRMLNLGIEPPEQKEGAL